MKRSTLQSLSINDILLILLGVFGYLTWKACACIFEHRNTVVKSGRRCVRSNYVSQCLAHWYTFRKMLQRFTTIVCFLLQTTSIVTFIIVLSSATFSFAIGCTAGLKTIETEHKNNGCWAHTNAGRRAAVAKHWRVTAITAKYARHSTHPTAHLINIFDCLWHIVLLSQNDASFSKWLFQFAKHDDRDTLADREKERKMELFEIKGCRKIDIRTAT